MSRNKKNPCVFLDEYLYIKSKKMSFNFDDSVNVERFISFIFNK